MKKIFSIFLIALALCVTSCKDEVEIADPGVPTNPEKAIEGVYTGTLTRTPRSNGEVKSGPCTLTIMPTEERYIATVKISCPDLSVDLESFANVLPSPQGDYSFYNNLLGNGFGAVFTGSVNCKVNEAQLDYVLSIKEGRKTITFDFAFEGTK